MLEAEKVLQLVDVERNSTAGGSAQHQRQQRDPCHPVRTCVRVCVRTRARACVCARVRVCVRACVCACAQKIPIRRLLGVCSRAARVLAATAIYLFIAHPVQSLPGATGLVSCDVHPTIAENAQQVATL